MTAALDVKTIRDLALWPPSIAARRLVGESFGTTMDPEEIQTEELRPRMGQYPTERVYYSTLTMLQMLGDGVSAQENLTGPISLNAALDPGGLNRPAIGALLTFSQSWYSQGVTLGHMLHSLALAPGEATRIAVIDWSRRTASLASESVAEGERLSHSTKHVRSLSEVQSAVAGYMQRGGSRSSSSSDSSSGAVAGAIGTGLVTSLFASGDVSGGYQAAGTTAEAESSGWSIGTRSIFAELAQNVNDRTEQHSNSVRNRRATAIREVSQSEHQQVSTRIVANYNHMHALTVQYYEVVQVYRTEVKLERADRCLFLPMELIDFDPENPAAIQFVERFRPALFAAALNTRIRFLLSDDSWNGIRTVSLTPDAKSWLSSRQGNAAITDAVNVFTGAVFQAGSAGGVSPNGPAIFQGIAANAVNIITARAKDVTFTESATLTESKALIPNMINAVQSFPNTASFQSSVAIDRMNAAMDNAGPAVFRAVRDSLAWNDEAIAALIRVLGRSPLRAESDSLFIPETVQVQSISVTNPEVKKGRLDLTSGPVPFTLADGRVDLASLAPARIIPTMEDITAIFLEIAGSNTTPGSMQLNCIYQGRHFSLPPVPLESGSGMIRILRIDIQETELDKEILAHLNSHRSYYSRAVFRRLDTATLTQVLSHYKWRSRPLIEIVEPGPVQVVGNYMTLRAPVDAHEDCGIPLRELGIPQPDETSGDPKYVPWQEYLQKRGLNLSQPANQRLIPIPTDGVFAEAVLGRANSAEKLDLTRFWNWQDSPIPFAPPEISPVGTGSRATPDDLKPGQLSPPVLNIVNPTSLPNPTGIGASLGALSSLNFRDMSGLAGTQHLVQAGMDGTMQAAAVAGQLASENMRTEAQKSVAMGQIAADLVKSLVGAGGSGSSSGGLTGAATKIAHGRKMDERNPASRTGSNADTRTGLSSGGSEGDRGESAKRALDSFGESLSHASRTPSFEENAYNQVVHGPIGEAPGNLLRDFLKPVLQNTSNQITPLSFVNKSNKSVSHKYTKYGFRPSAGWGKFDQIEYNSETQVLTITVKAQITIEPWMPPEGISPEMANRWPGFIKTMEQSCRETFRLNVECWGGWHRFVCNEPGISNLFAEVRCEVEEMGSGTLAPNTIFTKVTFGSVGQKAKMFTSTSIILDHTDGFDRDIDRDITALTCIPERPKEHIEALMGFPPVPPETYKYRTIMHEVGHLFGLGDEYDANEEGYQKGSPVAHTALVKKDLNKDIFHGWTDQSIMGKAYSSGKILDVHGVTFLEALRALTGLSWKFV